MKVSNRSWTYNCWPVAGLMSEFTEKSKDDDTAEDFNGKYGEPFIPFMDDLHQIAKKLRRDMELELLRTAMDRV